MTVARLGLTEKMERVITGVVGKALDTRNQWARLAGPRPLFWGEGDALDQLERYLDMRDDRATAAVVIAEQGQTYGRDGGEMDLATELIRMEALLAQFGGAQAVRGALLLRRIRRAKPVLKQIERIDALPEYAVLPALPAYDDLSVLSALAAGESPEFQPVIQTPADAMPQGGMTPYGNG